ncbi:hypothetical protein ACGF0C_25065 [Streptomyces albidoflavus]
MVKRTEVLLIGGRSGVGKSAVGQEVAALLREADVAHAMIEGDLLDQVYPAPPDDPRRTEITRANLAALWSTYAALGHHRLIYTNTVSVLEAQMLTGALDAPGPVRVTAVLLTAGDEAVEERLRGRERGSELELHLRRSAYAARRLDAQAPEGTVRVATDGRGVREVAVEVVALTGWLG